MRGHAGVVSTVQLAEATKAFKARLALLYATRAHMLLLFPGSSVVEQPAVNRLVAGSNPARGAKFQKKQPPKVPG